MSALQSMSGSGPLLLQVMVTVMEAGAQRGAAFSGGGLLGRFFFLTDAE
jgi:hypothetical protein